MGKILNQEEVKQYILDYCKTNNYKFINYDDYVYIKDATKNIQLMCNNDEYVWFTSKQIVRMGSGCKECSDKKKKHPKIQTEAIKKLISEKCLKINTTFLNIKDYSYINSHVNDIHLKCNVCQLEWETSNAKYLLRDSGCPSCGSKKSGETRKSKMCSNIKEKINKRCEENGYVFVNIHEWEYRGNEIQNISILCKQCESQWFTNRKRFIIDQKRCPHCEEIPLITENIKPLIIERCKDNNYSFLNENEWVYINTHEKIFY